MTCRRVALAVLLVLVLPVVGCAAPPAPAPGGTPPGVVEGPPGSVSEAPPGVDVQPPPPVAAPPGVSTPPPFSEVDPYTSPYFIALEGTGLVESQGAERLYNLGVNTCAAVDGGDTLIEQWAVLIAESRLGEASGNVLTASVSYLCPQHEDALQRLIDGGATGDAELGAEVCRLDPEFDPITCSR